MALSLLNILLLIAAYLFMEFVAWSNHKYVMHGFLWRWHKDHHVNDLKRPEEEIQEKRFEKNDLFFLVYAIPAIILMVLGFHLKIYSMVYIAIGISLYGLTYFLIHDVVYHKRIRFGLIQNPKSLYLKSVIRAHKAHHKPQSPSDFESYGLLIFPKRFYKK